MEFLDLLDINRNRLPWKSYRTPAYFHRRWKEVGSPTERSALIEFLDSTLKFCSENGLFYPKVFLKRLKQLQRSEWTPPFLETRESDLRVASDRVHASGRRVDLDEDLTECIRDKEQKGEVNDQQMHDLLREKMRRARERHRNFHIDAKKPRRS